MARSPIKLGSESDDIPTAEETLDFDDDTQKGEKKMIRTSTIELKRYFFSDGIALC